MGKKKLTLKYIFNEIETASIILDEIHNFHNLNNKIKHSKELKEARKNAKLLYYLDEIHPLICVYKGTHPNKKIKYPKFL
jgi:predicted AAA+ superfamily ATPase|tara:strand:- start:1374 stop:1613 length:240 start_codon:yes stop_codon:yes gene_type:complete